MRVEPSTVAHIPTSNKIDVSSTTASSSRRATTPLPKLSAQQELSLARRRLFYAQTIMRFTIRFQCPLWESEKEHLAQHLHLEAERPIRNEDMIRYASLFPQRAQGSVTVTYDPRSKKEDRDDLESDAVRKSEGDTIRYRTEAAEEKDDSEVDDIEDRAVEEELRWLGAEWESLVKILRQRDSGMYWDDVY